MIGNNNKLNNEVIHRKLPIKFTKFCQPYQDQPILQIFQINQLIHQLHNQNTFKIYHK